MHKAYKENMANGVDSIKEFVLPSVKNESIFLTYQIRESMN